MKILALLIFLSLCACAKDKKDEAVAVAPLISEIPAKCQPLMQNGQLQFGFHEFALGQVLAAVTLDCGVREGKQCFYYVHSSSSSFIDDVRCE